MADPTAPTGADTDDSLMREVRTALLRLTAPWTIEELAAAVGGRPEEVRPCVERLIEGGTVEELGEDPRDGSDEPAATLYGPPPVDDAVDPRPVL